LGRFSFDKKYRKGCDFMKILYDHQIFEMHKIGGISRYFYELIKNSDGLYDTETSGVFFENEYLKSIKTPKNPKKIRFHSKRHYNKKDSLKKIIKCEYSVLHPTYYDLYYLEQKHNPFVITIHDMVPEIFLRYYYNNLDLIYNKRILMEKADKIIAVSNNTKKDILNIYPEIPDDKISVIYHGQSFPLHSGGLNTIPQ